ncbi:hypothetical protein [Streptomyces sp. 1331.2]|uniref:hypothetical protein n=1 Tax=Streptomyces sp. 1331.2 TaxID=1938835 RepID=UPI000BD918A2|nr:hypothetical protein [Streptomyces sp. 1331.2]SOB80751.1 hypothetical protein SAMN06272789_1106 [Streptomyces sp. 1331.2]
MTLWPLDALAGLVTLALEGGAVFLYGLVSGLKHWAGWRTEDADRLAKALMVAVPAGLGAGFRWAGLPVSAWIQFAAAGAVVLVLLADLLAGPLAAAWRRRRPSRPRARTGRGADRPPTPPPGAVAADSVTWFSQGRTHVRSRAPIQWASALREAAEGAPFAELIVEVGTEFHPVLAEAVVDSGFGPSSEWPPDTSAAVEVADGLVRSLRFSDGRGGWEPHWRAEVTPDWLAAAEARSAVVVVLVPPGTWPPGLAQLEPGVRREEFARGLAEARSGGRVLHGMASLSVGRFVPPGSAPPVTR